MDNVTQFSESLAAFYEDYMVPMIFEPYANHLVNRVAAGAAGNVLETAAGTGIVTRKLVTRLQMDASSVAATDISLPMLKLARGLCPDRRVAWRQIDATKLPFPSESFDTVICQFGVMFFADRIKAYAEACRVLRPGGRFLFSVWDRIEWNEFADTVNSAVAALFPKDPPSFLSRIPHGYHDTNLIVRELVEGGFRQPPTVSTVREISRAAQASVPARALTQGTPLRVELEARGRDGLEVGTEAAEAALVKRFGATSINGQMQAHIITVRR
jgi:ubiquinone/menaquinone biosynthesis C-methylase UbiE